MSISISYALRKDLDEEGEKRLRERILARLNERSKLLFDRRTAVDERKAAATDLLKRSVLYIYCYLA
jgi:hypothetical protein